VRILIIDDDPTVRELIGTFLTGEGYQVIAAEDGSEALERLEWDRPALILLDVIMPGIDGAAFVEELRARTITTPFLVMTGADQAQRWADELGANGYVAKPISLPLLLARIGQLGITPDG
jgi:CheY-like chemotaxis protein